MKKKQADDITYNIMVAYIVMELCGVISSGSMWKVLFLRRLLKRGFIKEDHLKWIFVVENQVKSMGVDSDTEIPNISMTENDLVNLIWEDFNVREHFSQMKSHRGWLMESFHRIGKYMPELPEEVIERHDLSKFAFSQALGYTLMWVHGINHSFWTRACNLHLHHEPHH